MTDEKERDPFASLTEADVPHNVIPLGEAIRTKRARDDEAERDTAEPPPEEEAPELPPLQIVTPFSWIGKKAPSREWLIKDWVTIGSTTGLYGDGGLGKTLLLQQLQTSCASALPWMGMHAEPCESIGFYCEDDEHELHRRQEWINAGYGIEMDQCTGAIYVPRVGLNNTLMTFTSRGVGEVTKLFGQWREHALDSRVRLVNIDTAADVFAGNEIDRGQVRQFVQQICGKLAMEINGAVILAAHPSQAGMMSGSGSSGSTGWNNAFRSRMYLDFPKTPKGATADDPGEPPDPFARVLRRMKGNYAPRDGIIDMHWRAGLLVADSAIAAGPRRDCVDVYMMLVDVVRKEGKRLSPKPRAPTYAPTLFSQRPKAQREGYHKGDFERAQSQLFNDHKLALFDVRHDGKPLNIVDRADLTKDQLEGKNWSKL